MILTLSQEKFLYNAENKSRLITMLMAKCEEPGIACRQANEDADSLFVRTAESLVPTHQTVAIVGEDVDLMVIMMGLNTSPNVYLLNPGKGKAPQLLYQPQSAQ
ncbi:unnamed protein product [Psylliodes chrysocephalus]|uniref:Uncharacterized protein n=1 Tax=Psylliodes chrysocephalus TaxID=3402493 RepID=A0A9P0G6Z2_9CUCU|nr:unnamed protein product [Psylliodes chrysocephala]